MDPPLRLVTRQARRNHLAKAEGDHARPAVSVTPEPLAARRRSHAIACCTSRSGRVLSLGAVHLRFRCDGETQSRGVVTMLLGDSTEDVVVPATVLKVAHELLKEDDLEGS